MNTRAKLRCGFWGVCLLFVITCVIAHNGLNKVQAGYRPITTMSNPAILTLREIQFYFTGQTNDERGFLLTQEKEFRQGVYSKSAEVTKRIAILKKLADSKGERDLINRIADDHAQFTQINLDTIDQSIIGNLNDAKKLSFDQGRDLRKELHVKFDQLDQIYEERAKQNNLNAEAVANETSRFLIVTSCIAIILTIILGELLTKPLAKYHRRERFKKYAD